MSDDILKDILDEWDVDAAGNMTLGLSSQELAKITSKYIRYRAINNLKAHSLKGDLETLKHEKGLRIAGKLSLQELRDRGWEPFEGKILKNQYKDHIAADKDVIEKARIVAYFDEIVLACDTIIKSAFKRSYDLGNAIKHEAFLGGG